MYGASMTEDFVSCHLASPLHSRSFFHHPQTNIMENDSATLPRLENLIANPAIHIADCSPRSTNLESEYSASCRVGIRPAENLRDCQPRSPLIQYNREPREHRLGWMEWALPCCPKYRGACRGQGGRVVALAEAVCRGRGGRLAGWVG